MNDAFLIAILIILVFCAGALIVLILDLRRSSTVLREFVKNTEETLSPALEELELTLRSVRRITDDIGSVTAEARNISETLGDFSDNLRKVYGIVSNIELGFKANVTGLKAGIREGFLTLLNHIINRKEKGDEG